MLRSVDNAQVFRSPAFKSGLHYAALSPHDEIKRLAPHAVTAPTGKLFPPGDTIFHACWISDIYNFIGRGEKHFSISTTDFCQCFHMPDMILANMDFGLCRQQMERRELEISHSVHRPAIMTIGLNILLSQLCSSLIMRE